VHAIGADHRLHVVEEAGEVVPLHEAARVAEEVEVLGQPVGETVHRLAPPLEDLDDGRGRAGGNFVEG